MRSTLSVGGLEEVVLNEEADLWQTHLPTNKRLQSCQRTTDGRKHKVYEETNEREWNVPGGDERQEKDRQKIAGQDRHVEGNDTPER